MSLRSTATMKMPTVVHSRPVGAMNGSTFLLVRLIVLFLVSLTFSCQTGPSDMDVVEVRIFAASSLSESFRDLAARFEKDHPSIDVRLTFAGSQTLRLQLEYGAQADVYASANPKHMEALQSADVVARSQTFAENELVVIVPKTNPAQITRFRDLPGARRLVVGAEVVPVGAYTRLAFERAEEAFGQQFTSRVRERIVSEENNVRLVRAKVELGEADAAIVYRTDAMASTQVIPVPIPPSVNVRARYQIAEVIGSKQRESAARFVAFLRSAPGRQILARRGFLRGVP